jgi:hypothetical protein
MKFYFCLLIVALTGVSSCSRKCDCVPPSQSVTNWKIQKRFGGIAGTEVTLTEDQKNNILTINPNGTFSCKNMVTGVTVSGNRSMVNYNSIYGDRLRVIFSPKLPMLDEDFLILTDNPNGSMTFGDNVNDGYFTTFVLIP